MLDLIGRKKITVKARDFKEGNLNRTDHSFGRGIVIDGGFDYTYAEYEIEIPKSAKYELWARYANFDRRKVKVYLDGEIIEEDVLQASTGGWKKKNLKWNKVSQSYIKEGNHILKISTDGLLPHIEKFEFRRFDESRIRKKGFFNDTLEIYDKSIPFQIFFKSLANDGISFTLKRTYDYLKSGNFLQDYLDYLGIFDGKYGYKGPNFVQLDITNSCNNNCIGCWCNSPLLKDKAMSKDEKKETLPFPLVKELIDQLHSMGTREIYLSGGGEPFTHPDILPILRYIKSKNLVCYINTNFTLLNEERIKELIDLKIDHLTVSIWAGTAETYNKTHPNKTKETFYKIKEMLKRLNTGKDHFPLVKIYNVMFNYNYHEIDEMIQFAMEACSDSVEFTVIDTIPDRTEQLLLNEKQRKQLYNKSKKIKEKLEEDYYKDKLVLFRFNQFLRRISSSDFTVEGKYDKGFLDRLPCYIGWVFSRINANGDVNSCLKSHRIPVGNIYEDEFEEIWNSEAQQKFRNITLNESKTHPYFKLIGNDPTFKTGCYKSCDDIGRNVHMHKKIMSLSFFEKIFLRGLAYLEKIKRNYFQKNKDKKIFPRAKKKIESYDKNKDFLRNNLDLAGTIDSRKAIIGPEQVVIDLTNKCDTNCLSCWLYSPYLRENKPSDNWLKQELSYKVVKRLIDQLSDLGTTRIRFTGGGEPLLHPRIFSLCNYIKEKDMKCALTTNFLKITEENVSELKKLDELAVSIWAASGEMYEKIHSNKRKSDFYRIKELLSRLSTEESSPFVTISNVLMNINYSEFSEMYKFAKETGVDAVYFTPVDVIKGATDRFTLTPEQKDFILKKLNEIKDDSSTLKIENYVGLKNRLLVEEGENAEYDKEKIDKIPCYVGWMFVRVLANGDVCPCCRGVNNPMGNVYHDEFKGIWYSKEYNEFRSKAKYLKKTHPYFKKIDCYKECDNLMHNRKLHKRMMNLTSSQYEEIKKFVMEV